jgi:glycosidase
LLKEDANGYVSQSLKDYIFAVTERWMKPKRKVEDGIDGWRLDVASQVAIPFWDEWIAHCKSIFPDVLLIAEVYEFYLRSDGRLDLIPPEWQSPWLQEGLFNSLMNYNVFKSCVDYFITDMTSTSQFDAELEYIRSAHSPADPGLMQNHLGTHDTSRLVSGIVNRASLYGMTFVEKGLFMYAPLNPWLNTRKPSPEDNEIKKIMTLFIMTYIGSPHIYYGDEVGMWGALYQGAHKPMVWDDLTYENEVQSYSQDLHDPDSVEVDYDMLAFYRNLTRIRNNYEVVRLGDFETLLTDDVKKIYAFKRSYKKCKAVVILNNDEVSHQVVLDLEKGKWRDVLNDEEFKVNKNGDLLVEVGKRWGKILLSKHCY